MAYIHTYQPTYLPHNQPTNPPLWNARSYCGRCVAAASAVAALPHCRSACENFSKLRGSAPALTASSMDGLSVADASAGSTPVPRGGGSTPLAHWEVRVLGPAEPAGP